MMVGPSLSGEARILAYLSGVGVEPYRLGEEAVIDLGSFSLTGSKLPELASKPYQGAARWAEL